MAKLASDCSAVSTVRTRRPDPIRHPATDGSAMTMVTGRADGDGSSAWIKAPVQLTVSVMPMCQCVSSARRYHTGRLKSKRRARTPIEMASALPAATGGIYEESAWHTASGRVTVTGLLGDRQSGSTVQRSAEKPLCVAFIASSSRLEAPTLSNIRVR